jgi:hypothetical protein
MNRLRIARKGLLIASMALACALPARAYGAVLYDQTDFPESGGSLSDDFDNNTLDTQLADDFSVPAGQSWQISQVDAPGIRVGIPPPTIDVFLYANGGTLPGAQLFHQAGITATGGPNYSIPLAGAPSLGSGTYWISVVQDGVMHGTTDWYWNLRTNQSGNPAAFRNPGNGFATGCTDWGQLTACNGGGPPEDLLFKLSGTAALPVPPAPSNQVTFGALKRNTKTGTAKLTVNVPGGGTISLFGKGLVHQRPVRSGAGRLAARAVATAGPVKLLIKAKGKAKRKLNSRGKVKVKPKITFTPTGGSAKTQTKKIVLKKLSRH